MVIHYTSSTNRLADYYVIFHLLFTILYLSSLSSIWHHNFLVYRSGYVGYHLISCVYKYVTEQLAVA